MMERRLSEDKAEPSGPELTENGKRIAVLGATGRTGQQILLQAGERGLQVQVLARRPEKLGELRARVVTIEGTVTDPSAVERAVSGCDAVLSALGRGRDSPPDLMTAASVNMIAAIRKEGKGRLVILTDTGVGDPSDGFMTQKILRVVLKLANASLVRDSTAAARVIADSGVDWTLVRATMLTDGPRTGNYKVGRLARGMPLRVSRADVAEFMLSCAIEGRFIRERPAIGGGHHR